MYSKCFTATLIALAMIGLTGCSRTVEDVAKWEADGKVDKLTEALADPKAEVREAALQSLGSLKAEAAIDDIAACYNDSEDSVVLASVAALAVMENKATITPLIAALKLNIPAARMTAIQALGNLKAPSAVKPLAELLEGATEEEQLAVIAALAAIGREAGSQPLVDLFTASPSMKVRRACLDTLPKTGGSTAMKALVNALADNDQTIRAAAKAHLTDLGDSAIPSIEFGLRSHQREVRAASVALLRELNAIPAKGPAWVWFQLAVSTTDDHPEIDVKTVDTLVEMGLDAVTPLMEAAAHSDAEIRDYALVCLEAIGEPCYRNVVTLAQQWAKPDAKSWWHQGRSEWSGAPSWRIDLWAAVAAVSPQFEYDAKTAALLKAGGSEAEALITRPDFKAARPYIPLLINLLGDPSCAAAASDKLAAAGFKATLPLIAALEDESNAIAEGAAAIIGAHADQRAYEPLKNALQRRIDAGDMLSNSAIYTALIKLNRPDSEPLLMKVRPNTARAIQLFERRYPTARVIGADTTDPYTNNAAPVTIHLAYLLRGVPGSLDVTFRKDAEGDWHPAPALPDTLP